MDAQESAAGRETSDWADDETFGAEEKSEDSSDFQESFGGIESTDCSPDDNPEDSMEVRELALETAPIDT